MDSNNISKLQQFEYLLKQCILTRYNSLLTDQKKEIITATEFINPEAYIGITDRNVLQGKMLRDILSSVINISTLKELNVEANKTSQIEYGKDLENGIIELCAREISQSYKFDIDNKPELNEDVQNAFQIKNALQTNYDNLILNSNALEILNNPILQDYEKKYNEKAIIRYLENNKNNIVEDPLPILENLDTPVSNETPEFISPTPVLDATPVAEVTPVPVQETPIVITPTQEVSSMALEQTPSPLPEVATTTPAPISVENVQIVELDRSKYIKYDDKYGKAHLVEAKNEANVIDYYNKIMATAKEGAQINYAQLFNDLCAITTMQVAKEEAAPAVPAPAPAPITPTPTVLTKEQYDALCMKYANNEELTPEEYNLLMTSTPNIKKEDVPEYNNEGAMKLKGSQGLAHNNMLVYLLFITIILGIMLGAFIFNALN